MALNLPAETVALNDIEQMFEVPHCLQTVRDLFLIFLGKEVNNLPNAEKVAVIAEFREKVESNAVAVITQYIGINVKDVTDLRKKLRDEGVDLKVYKNTLAKLALNELELGDVADLMEGPTAWAFCKDPVTPARVLKDFSKTVKFVSMRGGVLEGKLVTEAELNVLASLPSRDALLAQVVGTIAAPLRNLVGALNAVPRNLVGVLDAIRKQKEEEGAAA